MTGHSGAALALLAGFVLIAVSLGMFAGVVPQSVATIPGISPQVESIQAAFTWSTNGTKLTVTPANSCPHLFPGCPTGVIGQATPTLVSVFTWGDGTPSMSTTGSSPLSHTYSSWATSGFWVVETFTVPGSAGSVVTTTAYALVAGPPPGATSNSGTSSRGVPPSQAPLPGFAVQTNGLVVNATDTTRYNGFAASSVSFAFGDGSPTAKLAEPDTSASHTFVRPGTFLVVETIAGTAVGSGGIVTYYNTSQPVTIEPTAGPNVTNVGPSPSAQSQAATGGFTLLVGAFLVSGTVLVVLGAVLWRRGA